ncbi:hypothetical protein P7C70_g61, partial [Phenoliferia sp. Uapishka_3]
MGVSPETWSLTLTPGQMHVFDTDTVRVTRIEIRDTRVLQGRLKRKPVTPALTPALSRQFTGALISFARSVVKIKYAVEEEDSDWYDYDNLEDTGVREVAIAALRPEGVSGRRAPSPGTSAYTFPAMQAHSVPVDVVLSPEEAVLDLFVTGSNQVQLSGHILSEELDGELILNIGEEPASGGTDDELYHFIAEGQVELCEQPSYKSGAFDWEQP